MTDHTDLIRRLRIRILGEVTPEQKLMEEAAGVIEDLVDELNDMRDGLTAAYFAGASAAKREKTNA